MNRISRHNQTADGLRYGYTYDAFGRLVAVHKETDTGVVYAQYRYNGLGFRIGWRYDTSGNGYVDTNDPWYWFCHDDAWRIVATFRATDTYPKEVFVHHNAGFGGYGGSSYIDSVILRDKEVKAKWSEEATEERGERRYYCQNWRADVSALLTDAGSMVEWAKYSSYGVPFALPTGDTDSDGDWDATDSAAITGTYDVRKDANLDGVINASDVTHANSITGGYQTLGRGILSSSGVANRKGYAGYEYDPTLEAAGKHLYHVRHRVYDADIGRWMRRDPLGYVDGTSLYEYVRTRPIIHTDPMGQCVHVVGGCAVGAVFGGGWEYISCKMRGEADCRCKAGCAAAAGCIEGACTAAFPGVWSRCLCGAVAAALEAGCQATLCSSPGGGTGNSGMCIAVEIVLRALANCTGGLDVEAQEKLLLWVFGMNLSAISDICDNLRDFARSDIAHAGVQGPKTVRVLGSHVIDRARSMPPACRASLLQSGAHR